MTSLIEMAQRASNAAKIIMFAHALGISGKMDVSFVKNNYTISNSIDLEGLFWQKTVPHIHANLNKLGAEISIPPTAQQAFQALTADSSINETPYYHTHELLKKKDNNDNVNAPILIQIGWEEHTAMAVLCGQYIFVCNKGAGTLIPSIKTYKITRTDGQSAGNLDDILNSDILKKLSNEDRKSIFPSILSNLGITGTGFRDSGTLKKLPIDIEQIATFRVKGQKNNNCTYTNSKRTLHVFLMLEKIANNDALKAHMNKGEIKGSEFNALLEQVKDEYSKITIADRKRNIDILFQDFNKTNAGSADLFNIACRYLAQHTNPNSNRSVEVGSYLIGKLKAAKYTNEEIHAGILKQRKETPMMFIVIMLLRKIEQIAFGPDREKAASAIYNTLFNYSDTLEQYKSKIGLKQPDTTVGNAATSSIASNNENKKAQLLQQIEQDKIQTTRTQQYVPYWQNIAASLQAIYDFNTYHFQKNLNSISSLNSGLKTLVDRN